MSLSIYVQVWLYTLFLATSLTLRISHGGNGNSRGKRRKCHKGEKVEDVECLNHNFFLSLFSLQSLQCGKGAMIVVQYSHHYCTEASLDRILLSFQFANDPCLASDSKVCM